MCSAFSKGTGVFPVGLDDDIFDLGGDSLSAECIATELSEILGRRFSVSLFVNFGTPRRIYNWVTGPLNAYLKPMLDGVELSAFNAEMDGLPAVPIHSRMLATGLGAAAPEPYVFWWFNNPRAEIISIAQVLGPDFPLAGMYSGGSIARRTPLARHREFAETIAQSYASELMSRFPGATFRLGGNCFGGRIADLVSQKLVAAGHEVEAMCTLEYAHTDLYDFPGRLLMMFGRQSESRFQAPIRWGEPDWEKPFRSMPQSLWVEGAHGKFFSPENVGGLAGNIRDFFSGPTAGS